MKYSLVPVTLLLVLSLVSCEVGISSPAHDYNYTATTLLYTNNWDDYAWCVDLNFPVRFQGSNYTRLCICSNSYVTFGGSNGPCPYSTSISYPKLLIDSADNYAYTIEVVATTTNVTIYYVGTRYVGSGLIRWTLTFFP